MFKFKCTVHSFKVYINYICHELSFCYGLVFLHKSKQMLVYTDNKFLKGMRHKVSWQSLTFYTQKIAGCYDAR